MDFRVKLEAFALQYFKLYLFKLNSDYIIAYVYL